MSAPEGKTGESAETSRLIAEIYEHVKGPHKITMELPDGRKWTMTRDSYDEAHVKSDDGGPVASIKRSEQRKSHWFDRSAWREKSPEEIRAGIADLLAESKARRQAESQSARRQRIAQHMGKPSRALLEEILAHLKGPRTSTMETPDGQKATITTHGNGEGHLAHRDGTVATISRA
jgi:hypothetical protein